MSFVAQPVPSTDLMLRDIPLATDVRVRWTTAWRGKATARATFHLHPFASSDEDVHGQLEGSGLAFMCMEKTAFTPVFLGVRLEQRVVPVLRRYKKKREEDEQK